MAPPTTEIVQIPLKAGLDVNDPDSPAGKILGDTFNTLMQQDGFQRAHKSLRVEDPSILQLYIDWDSIDSHKKFMSQPYYGPCIDHLVTLADGDLTVWHANFAAHAPSASLLAGFAAPATEVVGFYFSASVSDSDKSSFESNLDQFVKVMEEKAKGYRGAIGGWVIEEVEHPEIEGKAKLWQTMAGWDSVDAHMAFRETDDFKNNVHLLRPEFIKAVTMHHCRFQTI